MIDIAGDQARRSSGDPIRVGIVGSGFMAKVHSRAYRSLQTVYGAELPPVQLVRLADVTQDLAQAGADSFGWAEATDDWRRITRASDIDLVDIVTPNELHAEVALDAAEHGKHLFCEKPLANDSATAYAMYTAAERAEVSHQVNLVYRRLPAIQLAKQLIDEGQIGRVLHVRAQYYHQYGLDPALPRTWRFQREKSGGGAVADLGAHALDLARYLGGEIDRVMARSRTFYKERPAPSAGASFLGASSVGPTELLPVDVDDTTDALMDFASGAVGVLQASWAAAGYNNDIAIEIGGELGRLRFSWTRPTELGVTLRTDDPRLRGERVIVNGPAHPEFGSFAALAGVQLGQADAFVIMLREMIDAAANHRPATPSFEDGLRVCEITEAIEKSASSDTWTAVQRRTLDATSDPSGRVPSSPGAADA